MSKSKKEDGLYTLKEVADMTGYTVQTIRVYRIRHGLGKLIDNQWYLDDSDIEFIKSRRGMRGKGCTC